MSLFTDITPTTPQEILEREMAHTRNGLVNAIVCRRDHPTFGYKKADILERLAHLEGMLFAWRVITTGHGSANLPAAVDAAADALGIDLADLRKRAKAS